MNKDNIIVVVVLAVLVLGLGGFLLARPVIEVERVRVVETSVGAQSGQDQYWPVEFLDTATFSAETRINRPRETGTVLTLATSSPITLTAAQLCDSAKIIGQDWAGRASSTDTLTLPVAENVFADCLTTNGTSFSLIIYNDASAAASTTQVIAGSASTTFFGFDTGEDLIGGGAQVLIEVSRKSATEMEVGFQLWVESDA